MLKDQVQLTDPLIRCSDDEPWTERMKDFSLPSSSSNTAVTDALRDTGLPIDAPWISSLNLLTRKLLVFSPITKLIASMKFDLPDNSFKFIISLFNQV